MIIEQITVKKGKTYLSVEGKEYETDEQVVYSYRLKKGSEIDDATFYEMLKESEFLLCKKYLFGQIEKYSKTEKGYRDKLYEKGFHTEAIKKALAKAKELGYIDDGKFAERYYEINKNKKGVLRIKNELRQKGVSPENLAFLKEERTDDETVLLLAEKFMKRREKTQEEKVRLLRHLSSKGFSYDECMRAIRKFFDDTDA